MTGLQLFDVVLRGGAVGSLVLTAVLFVIAGGRGRKPVSVAALTLGMAAYVLVSTPNLPFETGLAARILVGIAGLGPLLVYWAGIELFLDRVVFHWWHWAIAAMVALFAWSAPFLPYVGAVRGVLVLAVYAHLLWIVLRSSADDLVEGRRQFLRWYLGPVAVFGAVIGLVELLRWDTDLPEAVFALHALTFVVLSGAFLIWALRLRRDVWMLEHAPEPTLRPAADRGLLQSLEQAMTQEIWREEGLTIGKLAQHLDVPEHRLRRVINQRLGHRNFAAFINGPRIAAAQAVLADQAQASTPVLTIAYDVGFASLGPFNRSFREITGESPTEYRARVLSGS